MIPLLFLLVLLTAGLVTDIRWRRLPNTLTLPMAAVGMLYGIGSGGLNGLWFSLTGAILLFCITLVLYALKAIGAGDVKLFTAIGALTGAVFSMYILVYSILYAGLIALLLLLLRNRFTNMKDRLKTLAVHLFIFRNLGAFKQTAAQGIRFPFMLAVVPGAITALVQLHDILL